MKDLLFWVGALLIALGVFGFPISISMGLYEWVQDGTEFKDALWVAFKWWASLLATGICVGIPCYSYGVK